MTESEQDTSRELDSLQSALGALVASPLLQQFSEVWDNIGMEERHRQDRREAIKVHLQNLLEEMLQEEIELKKKLVESVQQCSMELARLCEQLSLPVESTPEEWTLLEKEKHLRTRADILTKEKHDRIKRFKRLVEMEGAMCTSVGEEPHLAGRWQAQDVPSDDDLQAFRQRIEDLEKTKDQRQTVFFKTREEVLQIWEELEVEPETELELVVAKGDLRGFVLSADNMRVLQGFHQKIQDDAVQLEARALRLRGTIESLWQRLEVVQEERTTFNQMYPGYKPKIIKALEEEVGRLNELKRANMSKFVAATRAELNKIWDTCFFGEQQKREFGPAFSDEYTDDLLSAHESELDRMRGFFSDNKEIFKLVEKRENLWNKLQDFEKKANDPSRLFQNRGGQLLKDEKIKKQITKDLPKVEKELRSVLKEWENDHERHFVVFDCRYLDTIEQQWDERTTIKEKEKMKRHKVKVETTMMEMAYGSKPTTPIKRRAPSATTPTSAPSKVRRIGPSPLIKSATKHGSTRKVQTASVHGKKPPTHPSSGKTPGRRKPTASRKILGERNTPVASSIPHDDSFLSVANSSMASAGSYTDFQRGIHDGLDAQSSARSSTIPKSSSIHHLA